MNVTSSQAIEDIAEVLGVDPASVDISADLLDQGMDSVRVMELVEKWRSAGVPGIDFIGLAQDYHGEAWLDMLRRLQSGSH